MNLKISVIFLFGHLRLDFFLFFLDIDIFYVTFFIFFLNFVIGHPLIILSIISHIHFFKFSNLLFCYYYSLFLSFSLPFFILKIRVEGMGSTIRGICHVRCLIGDGEGYSPHTRVLKRTAEFNPGSSVSIVLSKETIALGKNMALELQVYIT